MPHICCEEVRVLNIQVDIRIKRLGGMHVKGIDRADMILWCSIGAMHRESSSFRFRSRATHEYCEIVSFIFQDLQSHLSMFIDLRFLGNKELL